MHASTQSSERFRRPTDLIKPINAARPARSCQREQTKLPPLTEFARPRPDLKLPRSCRRMLHIPGPALFRAEWHTVVIR